MNLQETLALIEALKASGVTRFKSNDFEIDLSSKESFQVKKLEPLPADPDKTKASIEATEKLKNLINTINMSPEELANKIFPDGAL